MSRALAVTAVFATVLVIVVVARIDLSPARDFLADASVRDSVSHPPAGNRYDDPSSFAVWVPSDLFVWDSLRSGHLPLWERLQGGGYPALVVMYGGVLHPIRWATALFPRDLAPGVLLLLSVYVAFLGMVLFAARELALSEEAAVLAAIVFVAGPQLVSYSGFSGSILPTAHLPWLLLLLRRAERRRSVMSVALLSAAIALVIASGHPSLAFGALAGLVAFALADAFMQRSVTPVTLSCIAAVTGVLLAAPVLFPLFAARSEVWSYKTQSPLGLPFYPLSLPRWIQALGGVFIDRHLRGACCADQTPFFAYVGPVAALFAAIAMMAAFRKPRLFALVGLAALFFALVLPGPWLLELSDAAPLKYLKPWYLAGVAGMFLACTVAAGFEELSPSRPKLAVLLAIALAGEYAWRAWPLVQPHRLEPVPRSVPIEFARGARITGLWGRTHLANSARLTGVEDVRTVTPIFLSRYHLWFSLIDDSSKARRIPTTRVTDRLDSPLVGDFNVRYLFENRFPSEGFDTQWAASLRDSRLSPLAASDPVVLKTPSLLIHERRDVRPRAHFAERVLAVPDLAAAMTVLRRDRTLVSRVSVIERSPRGIPERAQGAVSVTYPSGSSVVLETRSDTGGVVVLHDAFASGWRASIDEHEAAVFPVNVLSRGVVVPRGTHRVRMQYTPPGFVAGLVCAAATAALIGVLALVTRRRTS